MLSGWLFTSTNRDAHVHMTACLFFSYNTHTSLILKFGDSPFSWKCNFHIKFHMYHSSECEIWSVKTCFSYIMPPSKTKSAKRARKVLSIKEKKELVNEYSKRKVPFKMCVWKICSWYSNCIRFNKNQRSDLKFCSDTDSMLGLKHRYTLKTSENPKLDFATYKWFRQERFKATSISGKLTEIEILYELKLKFASELQAKWLSKRQKCSIWS